MRRTNLTTLAAGLAFLALVPAARADDGTLDGAMARYETTTAGRSDRGTVDVLGAQTGMTHQAFQAAFRPMAWFPELGGDASYDDNAGFSTSLDVDSDLALGDRDTEPAGEVDVRFGGSDLWISGFTFSRSGTSDVNRTVVFGSISFTGTAHLETKFDLSSVGLRYGYALFGDDATGLRFGPTLAVNWVSVKLDVKATPTGLATMSEKFDESAPLPALGLRLEVPAGDFLVTADAQALKLKLSDFGGTYYDLSAGLTWRPMENLGVFAGYRYIHVDADGTTGGRDFEVDVDLKGPFFGVEIRF